MNYFEKALKGKEEMTPETGFNIVLFDDFAPMGEMLTLVGHAETRKEAERIKEEYQIKAEDGIVYAKEVYIYEGKLLMEPKKGHHKD